MKRNCWWIVLLCLWMLATGFTIGRDLSEKKAAKERREVMAALKALSQNRERFSAELDVILDKACDARGKKI
jgi:hypothetical protein